MLRFSLVPFALAFLAFASISGAMADDLPVETLSIATAGKLHEFQVEVASDDKSRENGLMNRHHMAADHGMLFVFDGAGEHYFWMENTYIPLDIIFIGADHRIIHIAASATPLSRKLIPSHGDAKFVLELNGATAKKLGIKRGDKVTSPSMK